MRCFSANGVYVNFLGNEGEERVRAAYGPVLYARLAEVKAGTIRPTFFDATTTYVRRIGW
jgi:hypothetical protein